MVDTPSLKPNGKYLWKKRTSKSNQRLRAHDKAGSINNFFHTSAVKKGDDGFLAQGVSVVDQIVGNYNRHQGIQNQRHNTAQCRTVGGKGQENGEDNRHNGSPGLTMMGALSASYITLTTPLEFSFSGGSTIVMQARRLTSVPPWRLQYPG